MMIIQGIIELGYNIRSAWFLDIRISTFFNTLQAFANVWSEYAYFNILDMLYSSLYSRSFSS